MHWFFMSLHNFYGGGISIIAVRRAFKKQEHLNKKEENFLLSVSHELKTPIASVQLFLQTLQKHK
mgnify:CR=1 FL=1